MCVNGSEGVLAAVGRRAIALFACCSHFLSSLLTVFTVHRERLKWVEQLSCLNCLRMYLEEKQIYHEQG